MIVIGLTGSIGMGKTTAAAMFRRLGVPVHDSDLEVHRLLGPGGAAVDQVAQMFPESVEDDTGGARFINRSKLGRVIFADPEKRKRLEAVVHPLVRRAQDEFLAVAGGGGAKAAVLDIPLLFETGADQRVDVTVCVTAPAFVQRQRVMRRPGMTPEKFSAILASQMPDGEKKRRSDFIVQTGLGKFFALQQIRRILRQVTKGGRGMKPGKLAQMFKVAGLLVLAYGAIALFPWGMFAATAEKPEGEKLAQMASDPALKNSDAVVVELFTSQGCSSCPPAEAYLRDLAVRPDVIALEFHVDYWDDISPAGSGKWKDPFSSPQATLRQADYNAAIRQTQSGYTPQMVVDGWLQEVGSRRRAVAGLIEKAKTGKKTPVTLLPRVDGAGNLTVSVSSQAGGGDAELVYVRLLKRHVTQVQAGENKGEVLASYNIVTRWFAIGLLEEGKTEFFKTIPPLDAEETCAVLLQARKSRRILAAAFCAR